MWFLILVAFVWGKPRLICFFLGILVVLVLGHKFASGFLLETTVRKPPEAQDSPPFPPGQRKTNPLVWDKIEPGFIYTYK